MPLSVAPLAAHKRERQDLPLGSMAGRGKSSSGVGLNQMYLTYAKVGLL
jgi:hypothetical protein